MRWGDVARDDRGLWITLLQGALYPDILEQATLVYTPVMERFRALLENSESAADLYRAIMKEHNPPRGKLVAVFRRYFTDVSTENLGKQREVEVNIKHYGESFRAIADAKQRFESRPFPDQPLMAILYLNAQRGKTGYSLTELFFEWFESEFGDEFTLSGPKGGGPDLNLSKELSAYKVQTKADFLIRDGAGEPVVVGFARYDAHRGGAQEDDRIKGNNDNLTDLMVYSAGRKRSLRVLFLNDGPGLAVGSMWADYTTLEDRWTPDAIVSTLKMLPSRLTAEWIRGE